MVACRYRSRRTAGLLLSALDSLMKNSDREINHQIQGQTRTGPTAFPSQLTLPPLPSGDAHLNQAGLFLRGSVSS